MEQVFSRPTGHQATSADYRQQHLLRVLRLLLLGCLALTVELLIGGLFAPLFLLGDVADQHRFFLMDIVNLLVIGLLLLAGHEFRRNRIQFTAVALELAVLLGTVAEVSIWLLARRLDASSMVDLIPFCAVIVVIGFLTTGRNLALITLLLNTVTLALLLFNLQSPGLTTSIPFIVAMLLAMQWLFAALMITVQQGFSALLREVDTAYARSHQLDALKDAFISSVNHEVRTPLTAMVMYIDTLKHQHQGMTADQLQFGLEHASSIGQALTDMVKSILSTRQVEQEAADLSLEPLSCLRVINQVLPLLDAQLGSHGNQAAQRDLHLQVSPAVVVWADRVKLQQVLLNLLNNALKYSEPGTPIEISASYTTLDRAKTTRLGRTRLIPHEMVEIAIRDHGHGIAPDHLPLLFQKFVRLPADLASKVPGNGLGLYLCRLLIEAMGGTIWVESKGEGHGSTFFFRLPVPPPHFEALRNAVVTQRSGE